MVHSLLKPTVAKLITFLWNYTDVYIQEKKSTMTDMHNNFILFIIFFLYSVYRFVCSFTFG